MCACLYVGLGLCESVCVSSGSTWGQEAVTGGGGTDCFLDWHKPLLSELVAPTGPSQAPALAEQTPSYGNRNKLPLR